MNRQKKGTSKQTRVKLRAILGIIMALLLILPEAAELGLTIVQAEENTSQNNVKVYKKEGYSITYTVKSRWENHETVEITIENTGKQPVSSWAVSFDNTGTITGLWNAVLYGSSEEKYIIKSCTYNNTVLPGEKVTFGYTLEGEDLKEPEEIILCMAGEIMENGYRVEYCETGDWGTGFQGEIKIINESSQPIEGWSLNINGNFTMENYWNGEVSEETDGSYTIMHTTWENTIPAGGEHVIGFVGTKDEEEMVISSFKLSAVSYGNMAGNENEDKPDVGENETKPNGSESETKPNGSESETKPNGGESETKPNGGENQTKPDMEIDWSDRTDTDGDGLTDVYEINISLTNPKLADTDGDGLPDGYEKGILFTDPLQTDSDGNGIADEEEDFDNDGLNNITEYTLNTDPYYSDSDNDNLTDYDEVNIYHTNPALYDTDSDGVNDGDEIILGLDPNNAATNGIRDNEVITEQFLDADNSSLRIVNELLDNPFQFSIKMNSSGVAENNVMVTESSYSNVVLNDAVIGTPVELAYPDELRLEKAEIQFRMDNDITSNVSGRYAEFSDEFTGIKRFNVFKYYEDSNMLLPVETFHDTAQNMVCATVTETGTYCIMDMELWFEQLGLEMGEDEDGTESGIALMSADEMTSPSNIAVGIVLDACGSNEELFNMQKDALKYFAAEIYEEFPNTVFIIIYTLPGNKYAVSPRYRCKNYEEFVDELNAIKYSYAEQNFAMAEALYYAKIIVLPPAPNYILVTARNTDHSMFSKPGGYISYNIYLDLMDQNSFDYTGADNEMFLLCSEANKPEEAERNAGIVSAEEVGKKAAEYVYRKCKTDVSSYLLTTSMKLLSGDVDLTFFPYQNQSDYDKDGIRDIDEVDLKSSLVTIDKDGFVTYATLYDCLFMRDETSRGIQRFLQNAGSKLWQRLSIIRVVPILSDPTRPDTDGDGFFDSAKYLKQLKEDERKDYFYIDDPHPLRKETVLEWPVVDTAGKKVDTLSSCFEDGRNHGAIDISTAGLTQNVISSTEGKVIAISNICLHNYGKGDRTQYCNCNGGLGNYIIIESKIDKNIFILRYCHLEKVFVSEGDVVKLGDIIGTVGSTGNSGGFHLDFQIKFQSGTIIDPILFEQTILNNRFFMNIPKSINVDGSDKSKHCLDYLMRIKEKYGLND